MKIKANDYSPNEILKFMRQATNLTQSKFAKSINKSRDWCQSNEIGRADFYFKDFLELAKLHNFDVYIEEKNAQKND